jgi:hypothetical protein
MANAAIAPIADALVCSALSAGEQLVARATGPGLAYTLDQLGDIDIPEPVAAQRDKAQWRAPPLPCRRSRADTQSPPDPRDGPRSELIGAGEGHQIEATAVPNQGLRLQRGYVLARTTSGQPVLWRQRRRVPVLAGPVSHLRFDLLHEA